MRRALPWLLLVWSRAGIVMLGRKRRKKKK